MEKINIQGIDKARLFKALYDNAQPQGMGALEYESGGLSLKEAKKAVQNQTYFGYYKGRVLKVDIGGDTLEPWLYNRDNGEGAAERAIMNLQNQPEEPPSETSEEGWFTRFLRKLHIN